MVIDFLSNGTAWRIILDPINARFASSFSRKGIRAAATDTSCFGETSIKSTNLGSIIKKSPLFLHETKDLWKEPSGFNGSLACEIVCFSSSIADK